MKSFIVLASVLFSFSSLAHPASSAVESTLDEGVRILDMSGSRAKTAMCNLIARHLDTSHISTQWLGTYKDLARDARGVNEFKRFARSYMVTKIYPKLEDTQGKSGTYNVSQNPSPRGTGFVVPVQITLSTGKRYSGKVIVSSSYKIRDVEYLGFSGIKYAGKDIKKELDRLYNADPSRSLPVTEFIRKIKAERGFVNCG